jgi:hypothetical protein
MAPIPSAIFCRRGAAAPLDVEEAFAADVVDAGALVVLVLVPVLVDVFVSVFELVTTFVVMLEDVSVLVIVEALDTGATTTGCFEEVAVVVVVVSDVAVVVSVEAGAAVPVAVAVFVVWLGTNVLVTSLPLTLANVRLKSGVRVVPSTHSYR